MILSHQLLLLVVWIWGIEFLPQGKRSLLRIYIDKALNENVEPVLNEDGEVEQKVVVLAFKIVF